MRRTARFRQLIEAPQILLLPGTHDALSLKLAERAGFQAATCGGYSATASLIGQPDVGQLGMPGVLVAWLRGRAGRIRVDLDPPIDEINDPVYR